MAGYLSKIEYLKVNWTPKVPSKSNALSESTIKVKNTSQFSSIIIFTDNHQNLKSHIYIYMN